MINTKKELNRFIAQDRLMNGVSEYKTISYRITRLIVPNQIIRYLKYLRKEEYYTNRGSVLSYYYKYKKSNLGLKLGFSIPANVFGAGLSLPHTGTIVVSKYAKVGENCRLHVCTNIGASAGKREAPIIGNNCYIGPGAILFGEISVADNTTIAAMQRLIKVALCPMSYLPVHLLKLSKRTIKIRPFLITLSKLS